MNRRDRPVTVERLDGLAGLGSLAVELKAQARRKADDERRRREQAQRLAREVNDGIGSEGAYALGVSPAWRLSGNAWRTPQRQHLKSARGQECVKR